MKCVNKTILVYQRHPDSLSRNNSLILNLKNKFYLIEALNEFTENSRNGYVIKFYLKLINQNSTKIISEDVELKERFIKLGKNLLIQENIDEETKQKIEDKMKILN